MGREFELKYRATAEIQQQLAQRFGPFQTIRMETTYFDTPDGLLAAQKITLRLRKENAVTVCTLKTPQGDGGRGEWECQAQEIPQGLQKLLELGAPRAVVLAALAGVVPVCGARFTRLSTTLPTADGTAELALDQGILLGGGRELPLCEVELEYKTGSEQATVALADTLAAQYGLVPEPKSKFRRALGLAQGE